MKTRFIFHFYFELNCRPILNQFQIHRIFQLRVMFLSLSVHAQYGRDGFCVAFIVILLKFQRFQVLIRFSI